MTLLRRCDSSRIELSEELLLEALYDRLGLRRSLSNSSSGCEAKSRMCVFFFCKVGDKDGSLVLDVSIRIQPVVSVPAPRDAILEEREANEYERDELPKRRVGSSRSVDDGSWNALGEVMNGLCLRIRRVGVID